MPCLLICVDGSASDDDARSCREQLDLLRQRRWTHPPTYVDQVDEIPVTTPDELPQLRTVGIVMALPETDDADGDAVRADVAALVESMSGLARRAGIEFVVEYREETVGFLDGGARDARFVAGFFGDG